MRVISGKYKGKKLNGFDINGTRPTMDRVKESLFAIINPYLSNCTCLDLFAGSGALGIEALSNGAKKVTFVDNNKEVINVLKKNTEGIECADIVLDDALKYLQTCQQTFDIIFLDPPYHLKLINEVIKIILEKNLLKKGGLLVCEYEEEDVNSPLEILKEKRYGKKFIKIFKN